MKRIHFKDTSEFEGIFRKKTKAVTDAIVSGIEQAVTDRKKSADLFELTFDDVEMLYEISLPQSQWATALQSCLDHYHERGCTDECIDTWKLLEAVKLFN
mgnify:CR=1 FL=1